MRNVTEFLCAGTALLLIGGPASALDPFSVYRENAPKNCVDKDIGKEALGLPELIEIGLCNNPALNRDYMSVKVSESALGKAKAEYLPDVSASAELSDSYEKTQKRDRVKSDPFGGNIALSWLLYDFGGRGARIEREKEYLNQNRFSYNAILHDTVLSIHEAYLELLSSEEVLKSARTSEESYKKSYEESTKRYELGLVSLSDKLQAQTSYEQSKLEVVKAENSVKINQGELAILLNVSPDVPFKLRRPPKDKNIAALESGDVSVQNLMQTALKQRPEIKSSESALKAAGHNVQAAKALNYPSLTGNARAGYDDDWKYAGPYRYNVSAGFGLSVPIFTGFSNTYNIAGAKYQYRESVFALEETKESVKNEVWSAYQNYKTAVSSHEISKRVLESAVEAERVAFAMYQVGKGDILNLLTASANLASARKEVIVAFYGVLKSKSNLYRAVGRF